ncbi:MAG: Holliday junction branch migration protein RuvA [Deltaproteobacteria bacterium]|nr:Holliday junction branch migration protein RuvA [Deltaproteobacteria bacterium]
MIGFIQGSVISKYPDSYQCVVQAGQIGYELSIPRRLFEELILQQTATFWVHTHVREDQLSLFGFSSELEKQFFRHLLGVSGLGPKTALSLLGEHGAERLVQLILAKQVSEISKAPGVGKKLAERLVLELASKIEKWAWTERIQKASEENKGQPVSNKKLLQDDLYSALLHLGYQPVQIKSTLEMLFEKDGLEKTGFESVLRQALKELSSKTIGRELGTHA